MPIVNRTPYPTREIAEICRFVLGAAYEPVLARTSIVVTDEPGQMVGSGTPPRGGSTVLTEDDQDIFRATPGRVYAIGVAAPDRATTIADDRPEQGSPLDDWREKLVFNLATWRGLLAQIAAMEESPEAIETQIAQAQEGVSMALQRYRDATAAGQFSWQI